MEITWSKPMITNQDHERLLDLIGSAASKYSSVLAEKLITAEILPQRQIPREVVTMNSVVQLVDLVSGKEVELAVVYPHSAEPAEGRISVLAPNGVKLLGLRIGDVVEWPAPSGPAWKMRVSAILFQPEATGAWDL